MQRTFEKGAMELKGRRMPGEEVALQRRVNGKEEVCWRVGGAVH